MSYHVEDQVAKGHAAACESLGPSHVDHNSKLVERLVLLSPRFKRVILWLRRLLLPVVFGIAIQAESLRLGEGRVLRLFDFGHYGPARRGSVSMGHGYTVPDGETLFRPVAFAL